MWEYAFSLTLVGENPHSHIFYAKIILGRTIEKKNGFSENSIERINPHVFNQNGVPCVYIYQGCWAGVYYTCALLMSDYLYFTFNEVAAFLCIGRLFLKIFQLLLWKNGFPAND